MRNETNSERVAIQSPSGATVRDASGHVKSEILKYPFRGHPTISILHQANEEGDINHKLENNVKFSKTILKSSGILWPVLKCATT